MSYDIELAKIIKNNQRKQPKGEIALGEVKQLSPLKIMIFNGAATLTNEELLYTAAARSRILSVGTKAILIQLDNDGTQFLFLDTEG